MISEEFHSYLIDQFKSTRNFSSLAVLPGLSAHAYTKVRDKWPYILFYHKSTARFVDGLSLLSAHAYTKVRDKWSYILFHENPKHVLCMVYHYKELVLTQR